MTRALFVSRQWLSIKGQIDLTDDAGALVYRATGEFGPVVPTWTIARGDEVVARVRKRPMAWSPSWEVEGGLGAFEIRRKLLSWTRHYDTLGGPYDGAVATGSLSDLRFEIRRGAQPLARATGQLLSMDDRHRVEVTGEHEPFVAIALVVLLMDRAK